MVARAIHASGPYSDKPFVPVDCDSLAPMLMESELFGCVKLASSNGAKPREGIFALAQGGTVFLNEVGKLSMDIQAKLLRAMQDKELRPVGAAKAVPFDVRILAASSQDLQAVMDQGTFRRELYFRLNVVNLRLPPLRERKEDIRLLIEHFLEGLNKKSGAPISVSPEAFRLLRAYSWPGNLHELESCLQRAVALSPGRVLDVRDLPAEVRTFKVEAVPSPSHVVGSRIISLAEMEKQAIMTALEQLKGDKLMTAKLLGLGKTTLYRKLKEYGIGQPVTASNGAKANGVKRLEAR
jgi:DNA-binding NtrC family response regulator